MSLIWLKLTRYHIEGNFGIFDDLLRIHQSFTRQLLVAYEIAIEFGLKFGLKFAKVYFTNSNSACDSPKF